MLRELFNVSMNSLIVTPDAKTAILTFSELAVKSAYIVDGIWP